MTKTAFLARLAEPLLAEPLLAELRELDALKTFSSNTDVIGAHAEAVVRRLISRAVHPLRVSTGTVIDEKLDAANTTDCPQLDTIIWTPSPMPALFEVGDFGVVPRGSAMALMEIKSAAYMSGRKLAPRLKPPTIAKFVADDPPGWVPTSDPDKYPDSRALAVLCIRFASQRLDTTMKRLVATGQCVVLLEQRNNHFEPNPESACRLINFLVRARQRAIGWGAQVLLNLDAVEQLK